MGPELEQLSIKPSGKLAEDCGLAPRQRTSMSAYKDKTLFHLWSKHSPKASLCS